jgi:hypothetical protein
MKTTNSITYVAFPVSNDVSIGSVHNILLRSFVWSHGIMYPFITSSLYFLEVDYFIAIMQ